MNCERSILLRKIGRTRLAYRCSCFRARTISIRTRKLLILIPLGWPFIEYVQDAELSAPGILSLTTKPSVPQHPNLYAFSPVLPRNHRFQRLSNRMSEHRAGSAR